MTNFNRKIDKQKTYVIKWKGGKINGNNIGISLETVDWFCELRSKIMKGR